MTGAGGRAGAGDAAGPAVAGVLETALYVADLGRSRRFYEGLFGFEVLFDDDRLCALHVGARQVLLLFAQGGTPASVVSGGVIPPHGGGGQIHVAFAIAAADLEGWERRLGDAAVVVESRVAWPRGGVSLYFRDPDGHLLELATPGLWRIY